MSEMSDSGEPRAAQACHACKKMKRGCDKLLPECTLCVRMKRACNYESDSTPLPTPEDFHVLQCKVLELENRLAAHSSDTASSAINPSLGSSVSFKSFPSTNGGRLPAPFPAMFFLDSVYFEAGRFSIEKPLMSVPQEALVMLGDSAALTQMIEDYFLNIHAWFPIVSKVRLYQHLANSLQDPGPDVVLLFLSMKLVLQPYSEHFVSESALYTTSKSFLTLIESRNFFSVHMIQAAILIALYELGHALYPAAYLSIGHCARLCHATGLHHQKRATQMLPKYFTWTEHEERRRVYWAVVVLDRFVNTGIRCRPLATEEPSLEDHLPVDDDKWDKGDIIAHEPLALSAATSVRAAPFARTCQAAHLLGKVIRHLDDNTLEYSFRFTEAMQLSRTVRSFSSLMRDEIMRGSEDNYGLLTALAICYSALFGLYDFYCCSDAWTRGVSKTDTMVTEHCLAGMKEIALEVMSYAVYLKRYIEREGVSRINPFMTGCLYEAAANYAWYVRENGDPLCADVSNDIKSLLALIGSRWGVAAEYNKILEITEVRFADGIY